MPITDEYEEKYHKAEVNSLLSPQIKAVCGKILVNKKRYQEVELKTNIPWYLIGCIHYRESSLDFDRHFANGDPLFSWNGKALKTIHEPKDLGPYKCWQDSAIDILSKKKYGKLETLGDQLLFAEKYNGFGYYKKGVMSPYLWAGTSLYSGGKYVKDGVYDPKSFDKQLGVVCLLKCLLAFDQSTKRKDQNP